jgi:C_GCAxxG_C_C family probable redox protein
MNRQQVIDLARTTFLTETNIYGCAETSFIVLKHAFNLTNPADSSMAMALNGGVAWWGNICGGITGSALAVGQMVGQRISDHKRAKQITRRIISRMMTEFSTEFGSITCQDLIKLDIRKPEDHTRFLEENIWRDICMHQIEFSVTRLHDLQNEAVWQQIIDELDD